MLCFSPRNGEVILKILEDLDDHIKVKRFSPRNGEVILKVNLPQNKGKLNGVSVPAMGK